MLNSCCGFRLNTAGVIIGWLGVVGSILWIVLFGLCLGNVDEIVKTIGEQMDKNSQFDAATIRRAVVIFLCIYLTIIAINLVASALLIAGTVKERHLLLVPWLLNSGVSLLVSGIYYVLALVSSLTDGATFGTIAIILISAGINLTIQFYIWYAIYSLYKQIQANRDQQQRLLPTTASTSYPSYTKI